MTLETLEGMPLSELDTNDLVQLDVIAQEARTARLSLERDARKLKDVEERATNLLLCAIQSQRRLNVPTPTHTLTLHSGFKPHCQEWPRLYDYILATKDFSLLERRMSSAAFAERWELGITIPGVEKFPVFTLSRVKKGS